MDLRQELIIQILLRLPMKYLIRFKCVCKLWFSLISNPHFANSHFQLTTHTLRFLCISALSPEIRSIDFNAFLNDVPASSNFNCLLPLSYFPFEIKASCRDFIFLYRHWKFLNHIRKIEPCVTSFEVKSCYIICSCCHLWFFIGT
jgi:hypothetical protein